MFEGNDPLVSAPETGFLATLPAERVLAVVLLAMLLATMLLAHAPQL